MHIAHLNLRPFHENLCAMQNDCNCKFQFSLLNKSEQLNIGADEMGIKTMDIYMSDNSTMELAANLSWEIFQNANSILWLWCGFKVNENYISTYAMNYLRLFFRLIRVAEPQSTFKFAAPQSTGIYDKPGAFTYYLFSPLLWLAFQKCSVNRSCSRTNPQSGLPHLILRHKQHSI